MREKMKRYFYVKNFTYKIQICTDIRILYVNNLYTTEKFFMYKKKKNKK